MYHVIVPQADFEILPLDICINLRSGFVYKISSLMAEWQEALEMEYADFTWLDSFCGCHLI